MAAAAAGGAPRAGAGAGVDDGLDRDYAYDEARVEAAQAAKPWMSNPKHFETVRVSALAALKMMMHAHSGVEKGMKKGGSPIEIMGLMLGHVDPDNAATLLIKDVFPLPVEGTETRVLAEDEAVQAYMVNLSESIEVTRKERLCGWYHSHPFDVYEHSACFLSDQDVHTQWGWQRSEDPAGHPWLAIVVDPLRSIAKSRPEIGAFRAFPPEFSPPDSHTPDGRPMADETARIERWGVCYKRYYALQVEYFMSSLSSSMLNILSRSFLWTTVFGSTPMLEKESRERMSERLEKLTKALEACEPAISAGAHHPVMGSLDRKGGKEASPLAKPATQSGEMSIEHCRGQATQVVKSMLFNKDVKAAAAAAVAAGGAGGGAGAGMDVDRSGAGAGAVATAAGGAGVGSDAAMA